MVSVITILDLIGVAVFAISGALAAGRAGMDVFGVVVLAAVTAIGGGTLRDLLLQRSPVFWLRDTRYLWVILACALLTWALAGLMPSSGGALLIADALGLALFAICGAQVAEEHKLAPIVVVLMGTVTACAGGVLRDLLTGSVPLLLRRDIYATAAIAGIVLYLAVRRLGAKPGRALCAGMVVVAGMRLASLAFGWQLPVFRLPP